MIIDSASHVGPIRATVCIVGAGAAGITLACELDGSDFDVVLLEAGGFALDTAVSKENYGGTATTPHAHPSEFRRTGFGGTTRIWGGRCVPFDPVDFEVREQVPHSGWPIGYRDVAEHYPKALEYCHAGAFDFTVDGAIADARPTLPGIERAASTLVDRIERYSLPTDFGREHRKRVADSRNVTAVLNARCVRLHRRVGADAIESATIVDAAGARRVVSASVFVLALGGIETTRLLFVSDPEGSGLGNGNDRLGRFYACHFENVCAKLIVDPGEAVAFSFEKTRDGVYARRKLQFTQAAQREHRLLNTAFRLHFPDYSDASHGSAVMSAIFLAKSTLIPEYQAILRHGVDQGAPSARGAHLRNVLSDLPRLMHFGGTWLTKRVLARRKLPYTLIANADGSYPLEFNSEQIPSESSRIRLGDETDAHGMRRVHVEWSMTGEDVEAGARAFQVLRTAIAATGHARIEFDDDRLVSSMCRSVPVGGHHIGTTRMASSDRAGVVDRDCAVFGLPNLFVASASVFPVSSHANPTLTIVAMSIRLAGHLKSRLQARSAI